MARAAIVLSPLYTLAFLSPVYLIVFLIQGLLYVTGDDKPDHMVLGWFFATIILLVSCTSFFAIIDLTLINYTGSPIHAVVLSILGIFPIIFIISYTRKVVEFIEYDFSFRITWVEAFLYLLIAVPVTVVLLGSMVLEALG